MFWLFVSTIINFMYDIILCHHIIVCVANLFFNVTVLSSFPALAILIVWFIICKLSINYCIIT